MPKLDQTDWYDVARDMNWHFSYVHEDEVFPEQLSQGMGIDTEAWWTWDEPFKVTYRDYVYNQSEKDVAAYSVKSAVSRSKLFDQLDKGWLNAVWMHYGLLALAEFTAVIGEARMARFGRAAAWRNMATYGALDEMRHAQIQLYFSHGLINKHPRFELTHRLLHSNQWAAIAVRRLTDELIQANDAVSMANMLTYVFETGFTNLQFLGMASDAMQEGDVEFGALISSIQTDESRHAQQGEPTLRILLKNGKKQEAQQMIDRALWLSWRVFGTLTGVSMDYYTPLEHRTMSFKEFMEEWILRQFMDQFRDFGMNLPWYWDILMDETNWFQHSQHLGFWQWRPTVWWDPDAGISEAEKEWLEAKYPGWNDHYGEIWRHIAENVRHCVSKGTPEATLAPTLPVICNMCQLPIVRHPYNQNQQLRPYVTDYKGRRYNFCSEPCKWIFDLNPEKYADHLTVPDRFVRGVIQPQTMESALAYMGMSPDIWGDDGLKYSWAFEPVLTG